MSDEAQPDPFELLVNITAEAQKTSRFSAAAKLTVMSTLIGATQDAERFAEIARARLKAGDKE